MSNIDKIKKAEIIVDGNNCVEITTESGKIISIFPYKGKLYLNFANEGGDVVQQAELISPNAVNIHYLKDNACEPEQDS